MECVDKINVLFVILFFTQSVCGNDFYNPIKRNDPCTICDKTTLSDVNSDYIKLCCQRGCRIFNLIDLYYDLDLNHLNGTIEECKSDCTKAYQESEARSACYLGCQLMAKQRIADIISITSIAAYVNEGFDINLFLMSSDIPENDILTDPALRRELFPGWWDMNGFKLPETYVKTVPLDTRNIDYSIPSDYSVESDQSVSILGSDWFECTSRRMGIASWVVGTLSLVMVIIILYLCLTPEPDSSMELLINSLKIQHSSMYRKIYEQENPRKIDIIIKV